MRWWLLIPLAGSLWLIQWLGSDRPVFQPPGVLVSQTPQVRMVNTPRTWETDDGLHFTSIGELDVRARILSRNNVVVSSWKSISPVDLGLGWGQMSDSTIVDQIEFEQYSVAFGGTRFLWPRIRADSQIRTWPRKDLEVLFGQLTHVHAIAADNTIARQLARLRSGQVVELDGQLVRINRPDGSLILNSSTQLGDTDCEVMWVQSLRIVDA